MARLNIERQIELEPKRLEYAKKKISDLGYEIVEENGTSLKFKFKGEVVTIFPYSGWHTGKSICDGRGLSKLIRQLSL